jgi:hypothetical protein
MSDPDDGEIIICYGGAKPTDMHLASTVHCFDDAIIEWLERRERRRYLRSLQEINPRNRHPVEKISVGLTDSNVPDTFSSRIKGSDRHVPASKM